MLSDNDKNIYTKISLSILFIFYSLALFLSLYSNPGYNISIYNNLPYESLILILLINISGFIITILNYKWKSDFWKLGFVLIILSNFIILILPFLTGYVFGGNSDHLTHVGYIKDILQINAINYGQNIIYPITHLLGAEIYLFANIPVNTLSFFIGPTFYLMFILYIYIFSNSLTPKSKIFATLCATFLIAYFYYEIFPMGFAFLTYPLFFYVFFRYREKREISFLVLTIVLLITMLFFHVIAAIILTLLLVGFELFNKLFDIIYIKKKDYRLSFTLSTISLILIITWIWQSVHLWQTTIENVIGLITLDILNKSLMQEAGEGFSKLGLNNIQILEYVARSTYLPVLIFVLLSAFSALNIIFKKSIAIKNRLLVILALITFLSVSLWMIDNIFPLTTLTSGRLIWLAVPFFPIFVGLTLYNFIKTTRISDNRFKYSIVTIIFISLSLISILSVYPSPSIYDYNTAVSHTEMAGFEWIINGDLNYDIQILSAGFAPAFRYDNALNGTLLSKEDKNIRPDMGDHFNYTQFNELGDQYSQDTYLVTRTNFLITLYSTVYKKLNRFNNDDFTRLNADRSASEIYDNGDANIWYIRSYKNIK